MTEESTEASAKIPKSSEEQSALPSPQEIAERANEAIENASALQKQAKEQVEQLNHTAITFIQDQPLIALGVAFGAGYLLGAAAKRRWII